MGVVRSEGTFPLTLSISHCARSGLSMLTIAATSSFCGCGGSTLIDFTGPYEVKMAFTRSSLKPAGRPVT